MESEKRYYLDDDGNICDAHDDDVCLPYSIIFDRLNALEAERDELKQYIQDLLDRPTYTSEYEQLRKASWVMMENYRSLEAERDRYKTALSKCLEQLSALGYDMADVRLFITLGGGDE